MTHYGTLILHVSDTEFNYQNKNQEITEQFQDFSTKLMQSMITHISTKYTHIWTYIHNE